VAQADGTMGADGPCSDNDGRAVSPERGGSSRKLQATSLHTFAGRPKNAAVPERSRRLAQVSGSARQSCSSRCWYDANRQCRFAGPNRRKPDRSERQCRFRLDRIFDNGGAHALSSTPTQVERVRHDRWSRKIYGMNPPRHATGTHAEEAEKIFAAYGRGNVPPEFQVPLRDRTSDSSAGPGQGQFRARASERQ